MNSKILLVAPFNTAGRYKGGISYVAESIFAESPYLNSKGYDISCFNTCIEERNTKSRGKVRLKNFINANKLRVGLDKEIRKKKYDIVYYHTSNKLALVKDLLSIIYIKRRNSIKIVLHIHFAELEKTLFNNKWINKWIISLFNKYVDKIVFLSTKTQEEFIENGLEQLKTVCIYNFHTINFEKETILNKIEKVTSKNKIDILFLGSIDKRKGIIDALKALLNINKNFTFHVCGVINDQDIKEEFENLLGKLNNHVILHGYVSGEDKLNILLNSDVLLLPSYGEGLPISMLEAMACGCSVITTPVGAIPEIIQNEINGYIINQGNIQGLSESINTLIINRDLCKQQMLNNYYMSQEFSIHSFLQELCSNI